MGSFRDIRNASKIVFRHSNFHSLDGVPRWRDASGAKTQVTLEDQPDEEHTNCRLWSAVQPGLGFMNHVLATAGTKRAGLEEHQQFGVRGLIVATDKKRANIVRTLIDCSGWRVLTHDALPTSIPEQVLGRAAIEVEAHILSYFIEGAARTIDPAKCGHSVWVFLPRDPELVRLVIKWIQEH
jgi:hypothetical protein